MELPSLFQATLRIDIETAGYYELLSWCKNLNLSEKGDVRELRERLFDYYGLSGETKEAAPPKRTITIKSAKTTEYFSLEEIDEKYILLEGDIIMEMTDRGANTKHTIRADRILYNQTEKTVTAEGNITYVLTEKGKDETFTGTSMNFNVETWAGLFFEGTTQTDRTVESKEITYYITGKSMYRSGEDTVVLTDGRITSSDLKNPYYQVKTKKIWILGPGEWALQNAVLYVGTVPLFYMPFYFKTGDEIFFHPVMGLRDKEGFFGQTTTYIFGQRKKTEEPFSFLQISDENEEDYKKEIKGLYLRKTRVLTEAEKKEQSAAFGPEDYLKIMADFYSRLGIYAGVEAAIVNKAPLENLNFYFSLARSRNIFISQTETGLSYTPLYPEADGTMGSYWNQSNIFSLRLPFRYGMFAKVGLKNNYLSLTSSAALFSDPLYLRDFNKREEKLNWIDFLGITGEETGEDTYDTGVLGYSELSGQNWDLNFRARPDMAAVKPYINELNVNNLDISLTWKKKNLATEGVTGLDPLIEGYVPAEMRTEYAFPEKEFFYPESYLFPRLSLRIAGDLTAAKKTAETKREEEEKIKEELPGAGIKAPWMSIEGEGVKEDTEEEVKFEYRVPDKGKDIRLLYDKPAAAFEQQLSYVVSPTMSFDSRTLSGEWLTPADINFIRSYSLMSAYGSAAVTYKAAVFKNLFVFQDSLTLSGDIRSHFVNTGPTEEEIAQFIKDDSQATFLKLVNSLTLSTFPFSLAPRFKETSFQYQLDTTLFNHKIDYFDEAGTPFFKTFPPEWTKDYITAHRLLHTFSVSLLDKQQTIEFQSILPPLVPLLTLRLTARTGPFTTILSQSYEKPEDEDWSIKPFTVTEQFTIPGIFSFEQFFSYNVDLSRLTQSKTTAQVSFFKEKLSFKQTLSFGDFVETDETVYDSPLFSNPYLAESTLKLWWLTGVFTARRFIPYEFSPDVGWRLTEAESFRPEKLTIGFNVQEKTDPFWKNRIQFSINTGASLALNFNRFTDSIFSINLGFTFSIAEFLDFSFSLTSENKQIYKYFSGLASQVGVEPVSIVTDIFKSFNIFNETARRETSFNAKKLSIKATHYLKDWNLIFDYQAFPELQTLPDGFKYYEWERQFSILVKWNPVPELKSTIQYKNKTLGF